MLLNNTPKNFHINVIYQSITIKIQNDYKRFLFISLIFIFLTIHNL